MSASDGYVDAVWVGPGGMALDTGTLLVPNETVVRIPEGEAHQSDNWHVKAKPRAKSGDNE